MCSASWRDNEVLAAVRDERQLTTDRTVIVMTASVDSLDRLAEGIDGTPETAVLLPDLVKCIIQLVVPRLDRREGGRHVVIHRAVGVMHLLRLAGLALAARQQPGHRGAKTAGYRPAKQLYQHIPSHQCRSVLFFILHSSFFTLHSQACTPLVSTTPLSATFGSTMCHSRKPTTLSRFSGF